MQSNYKRYDGAGSPNSDLPEHQLLPKVRRELLAYPQIYDGQPYWVIKDPVSLRYYRFNREEYFIINQLRNDITLAQLKAAHRKEFRTDCLNNAEVAQFVRALTSKGVITIAQPDRDEVLYRLSRKKWWLKTKAMFQNFLFVKIPVFDPDKILGRIWEHLRFIWTWPSFVLYLALMFVGLGMILHRWDDFSETFSTQFFTIYNMPLLLATLWIIKGLHEFGHGLTCKNYGGEVHEMGWLFLVFVPFFYCNVTDSWTFPHKRHRIFVTAAGIMTEMIFAGIAAIVWYYTNSPDFINLMAFNVVVACSFQTVLFNANPLLRYDGYYMLMDLIEVPNLRQRSNDYMRNLFVRCVLGGHSDEMPEEHRFRSVFPFYSVSAYLYRWFILFAIMFGLYRILDGLHLAWLGQVLVVLAIWKMMLTPLVQGGSRIAKQRIALGISNTRLVIILAILVILVGMVLFWPMEQHVTLNFVLEPAQVQLVRTGVDGQLQLVDSVKEGSYITVDGTDQSGTVALLENRDLQLQIEQTGYEIQQFDIQIDQLRRYGQNAEADMLIERRESKVADLERLRSIEAELQVQASFSGEVLGTVSELDSINNRFLRKGTILFLLADNSQMTAKVWVSEDDLARIFPDLDEIGQAAELMLYAFPGDTFTGHVAIGPGDHCEDSMGEFGEKMALSHKVGGEVYTEYDYYTRSERPTDPVYEITIELDDAEVLDCARPYMSGRVRIACGRFTLFQWGCDSLLRFISPDVRL
ncbi:MAG: HlyD family efflux transporter periplasmic adaptor subunit [Sedimentisphaerales bacterium]|nr:HlyD family efflux transporter periplasmic adaptor subunit [Sedimentisphaerales bacterium]